MREVAVRPLRGPREWVRMRRVRCLPRASLPSAAHTVRKAHPPGAELPTRAELTGGEAEERSEAKMTWFGDV